MNDMTQLRPLRIVGTRPVRPDGVDKVTGKATYSPDFTVPGMLHGAILRSPHPHARIRAIDTRRAAALPGVKAVVTGQDFPDLRAGTVAEGEAPMDLSDIAHNCMARAKVLYEGHAVAAVAATTAAIAAEALRLIDVDYDVLPFVTDIEAAMAPGAPILHEDMRTKGAEPPADGPSNIPLRFAIARGDAAAAMAGADVVVEGRYATELVHQGYIEPHACVVSINADGQGQIWSSSQGHFMVRALTAGITGMRKADLRVTPLEIGGGFGGKTTVYLEPVAALLSRKSGRPVRLTMSRDEVFRASGPAPASITHVRLGAMKDGTIVAAEIDLANLAGAFPGAAVHSGVMSALGCYNLPHFKVAGCEVVANVPSAAAYRAPGAPQSQFAVECAIDDIARQIGMDPIDLRLKNAVRPGDPNAFGMPQKCVTFIETLEAARAHPHYRAALAAGQGRGIAAGNWGNYGGESTVAVSLTEDGSVVVTAGNPDIGGTRATQAMMAAEVLEVPYDSVRPIVADTASIGFSMLTGGSRTTFATGKAIVLATQAVLEELKKRAAILWDVPVEEVAWADGAAHCKDKGANKPPLTIGALASGAGKTGGPISAEVTINPGDYAPGFGVHICDVAVDPETGITSVVRYTAVQDVGRAIHPSYVEGQLQGGAAQGIGWALNEAYLFDANGRMDNAGFLDYRMPVASDLPMIDTVLVEIPNPAHPFGAKGVGEVPIVPPLAAVANAVCDATGVRIPALPLTPQRVYQALHGA